MIKVVITCEMIDRAKKLSEQQGVLNRSFMNGEGNLYGYLGEEVFLSLFPDAIRVNTVNCDFLYKDKKVDIKTKHCTTSPKLFYECSVADYLKDKQKNDYYAFIRVKKDLTEGWFLGMIKKEEFFKKARYMKKGQLDKSNNYTVRHNCYNLKIGDLDVKME